MNKFTLFLSFFLSVSSLFAQQYTLTDDDVVVEDGVITSCNQINNGYIRIPDMLDGQKVTGIGEFVFWVRNITEIILPSTLESIGAKAFMNCTLKSLNIPASCRVIETEAFINNELTNVTFEENSQLRYLGNRVFEMNSELQGIALPTNNNAGFEYYISNEGVKYSAGQIFSDFYDYLYLDIPYVLQDEDVDVMDSKIISYRHNGFKNIVIPRRLHGQEITIINTLDFNNLDLFGVTFSDVLKRVGGFKNNNIKEITIPASVDTIYYGAFDSNWLNKVNFEEESHLHEIQHFAFADNIWLDSYTLPMHASAKFKHYSSSTISSLSPGSKVENFNTSYQTHFYPLVISFNGNEHVYGTAPEPISIEFGQSLALPDRNTILKPNYKFEGWNTLADGTGERFDVNSVISWQDVDDYTLYCEWEYYVGIDDEEMLITNIYPNPATSSIAISIDVKAVGQSLEIYSISGAKVKQYQLINVLSRFQIGDLPNGVYLLFIDGKQQGKLVKN